MDIWGLVCARVIQTKIAEFVNYSFEIEMEIVLALFKICRNEFNRNQRRLWNCVLAHLRLHVFDQVALVSLFSVLKFKVKSFTSFCSG